MLAGRLRPRAGCSEGCTLRLDLVLDGKTAQRLHLTKRAKAVTIGTARASFAANGSRRIGVRPNSRAKRALKNVRSVHTTLRATATDAAGNRRTRSARVRITR